MLSQKKDWRGNDINDKDAFLQRTTQVSHFILVPKLKQISEARMKLLGFL